MDACASVIVCIYSLSQPITHRHNHRCTATSQINGGVPRGAVPANAGLCNDMTGKRFGSQKVPGSIGQASGCRLGVRKDIERNDCALETRQYSEAFRPFGARRPGGRAASCPPASLLPRGPSTCSQAGERCRRCLRRHRAPGNSGMVLRKQPAYESRLMTAGESKMTRLLAAALLLVAAAAPALACSYNTTASSDVQQQTAASQPADDHASPSASANRPPS